MSSVLDDINKRRTRQSVGEQQPTAPVEPVAPVAQTMGDQASARVAQGAMPQAESGFNPTAEQKAETMALMNPATPGYTIPQQAVAPAATTPVQPVTPKQMTYTDLHEELYKPMTPEEKAAQQKRQRNRQIINAVGEGISALANLYYTNKSGVNAYDPSTSLTKAAKERYDKLLAQQREDEERYKAMAYQAGAADIEMAYRRAKDAAAEKRADKAAADAAEARRLAQENWQKTFDYGKEKDAADREERAKARAQENETKKYIADLNAEIRKEYNANLLKYKGAKASEKTLGEMLPFYNNEGEPIVIYENVWNTSRQQVYNDMLADGVEPTAYEKLDMNPAKMDNFIKKKWMKSPKAVALMKGLALITPTTLPVQFADEDDYSQYAVGGDDYSQYIVE